MANSALRNPLRWYLAALLVGLVLSLLEGYPQLKFQANRLTQILPAVGLLAWTYRRQPAAFFQEPVLSGWYGLGLVGFAAATLLSGALGVIPWISLGFLGVMLLLFGLLPLLQPAWREHGADTGRVLALFAVAVLGMDVAIWLLDRAFEVTPYAWVLRPQPNGQMADAPYLFLNPRWANQLSVLLIWSFVPLLQQLQSGLIQRWRPFWWSLCGAIPLLGMGQVVLSRGDGAFLGLAVGAVGLAVAGWRSPGAERRLCWSAAGLVLLATVAMALLSAAMDAGQFFGQLLERNAEQLAPAPPDANRRIVLWPAYARAVLEAPWLGVGIPAIAPASPECTPHNLWLGLLYWTGLVGTAFAAMLASAFVPWRWRADGVSVMALPLLLSLFVYQLVDDIWLRPLALAVLLLVLSGLKCSEPKVAQQKAPQRWLQRLAFPAVTYRLLAVVGVLLITLSTVVPGGVGFAPSDLVTMPKADCLLLF
jgi:hypothetical protein